MADLEARDDKTGKWVRIMGMCPPEHHHKHVCSICDSYAPSYVRGYKEIEYFSRYCPFCGAYMTNNEVDNSD